MSAKYLVDTDYLRYDSKTWLAWRDELTDIRHEVPLIGRPPEPHLGIPPDAFSILPGPQKVREAFVRASGHLVSALLDGEAAMDGIARKLNDVAGRYEDTERQNLDAIRAIRW